MLSAIFVLVRHFPNPKLSKISHLSSSAFEKISMPFQRMKEVVSGVMLAVCWEFRICKVHYAKVVKDWAIKVPSNFRKPNLIITK